MDRKCYMDSPGSYARKLAIADEMEKNMSQQRISKIKGDEHGFVEVEYEVVEKADEVTEKAAEAAEDGREEGYHVMALVSGILQKIANAARKVWEFVLRALGWILRKWDNSSSVGWAKEQLTKLKSKIKTQEPKHA